MLQLFVFGGFFFELELEWVCGYLALTTEYYVEMFEKLHLDTLRADDLSCRA